MNTEQKLRIGDMSENGQVTIVDEDRLCYLVKSESRGAVGLRTISKALLKEFVDYMKQYPEVPANEVRFKISGQSDIDKYEYGYGATISVMAKMILQRETIIHTGNEKVKNYNTNLPLQQIYYGAPGTGKSHIIHEMTSGESVIRTTFHPDSDYSTFVGCYKPTTKEEPRYTSYGEKAIAIKNEKGEVLTEDRIVYEFVDQAFLQAYVRAWKAYAEAGEEETATKQFLVIEEINRGNCAQIFGDLFQLLDRNAEGFSDYPIQADNDMRKHLKKAFDGLTITQAEAINALYKGRNVAQEVMDGKILLLPNNLYIWATMNTSDQSLFPIDSAFKRRWDWQYMPISKGRDAKGEELQWAICAEGKRYDWWSFLEKINEQIGATTNSEDKKLGYFFCKPFEGCISAETFVGKVVFYLWNDVFKDYGFDNTIFNDDEGGTLSFDKFYTTNHNGKVVVCEDKVVKFLENLGVEEVIIEIDYEREEEEESSEKESTELKKNRYKYWSDLLDFIAKTPYENILNTQHRKPSERKYYDFYLGVTHCNLSIDYDSNIPNVGFWIGNQDIYDKIELRKAELEQICGPLKWISMNKAHKIRKEISIVGKSQEEQFKLYVDELVKMHEFFVKYIK